MVNKPELAIWHELKKRDPVTADVMALTEEMRVLMARLVLAGWTFQVERFQDNTASDYWIGKDPNEDWRRRDLYRYELGRLIEACNTRQREHEEAECQATSQSA